jgi:hypothetical protein
MLRLLNISLLLVAVAAADLAGQQVADTAFNPEVTSPAFPAGDGPTVLIDEAHFNFHTASGRYLPFATLLRRDGYTVIPSDAPFTSAALGGADILVVANAIAERNVSDWSLPTPSAFTADEIAAVQEWVAGGGSLMLIADHMPFPGAAERLAAAFGLLFGNGFALDPERRSGTFAFRHADGSLVDHMITRGRRAEETVDHVVAFTGQAFRAEVEVEPLLVLASGSILLLPVQAWQFSDQTASVPAAGLYQGAVLRYGEGRVAAFGEAAMFSAQVGGPERRPMGMNAPAASRNPQFLLNVMHWLSGLLDDG